MTSHPQKTGQGEELVVERDKQGVTVRTFKKGKFLGKGGFAKVYEFTDLSNQAVWAGKTIAKGSLAKPRQKQKLMSEIKIHKKASHPNIVRFEHVFEDEHNVYILLELCKHDSLADLAKKKRRLTDQQVRSMLRQILSGVMYLHESLVIHRDLKLGNLFLDEGNCIKIGDFGLATRLEHSGQLRKTMCGTPNYIAPEILAAAPGQPLGHSFEVDTWAIGVILYTLLVGKPPFETNDVKLTYTRIKQVQYSFPPSVVVSQNAMALIKSILVLDAKQRPSLQQIMSSAYVSPASPLGLHLPASSAQTASTNTHLSQQTQRSFLKENKALLNQPSVPRGRHQKTLSMPCAPVPTQGISTWVTKWVDYSSKYGLGYLLSDGGIGVYFNDSSKILQHSPSSFLYVSRDALRQEQLQWFPSGDFPPSLTKKHTLLAHFQNYLQPPAVPAAASSPLPEVYVKKWMKTKQAIMFRLSNKVIQVVFKDQTEILLCSDWKFVQYLNKEKHRANFPLSNALESDNTEMAKRLKYTKEILSQMLGNHPAESKGVNNENVPLHLQRPSVNNYLDTPMLDTPLV